MTHVSFALIGCGRVSYKHVQALYGSTQAKLVAVCDLIPDKASKCVPNREVRHYLDYHLMLQQEAIDVVVILTENGSHVAIGLDIVRNYGKHLIIEKPLALNLDDADTLIGLCQQAGTKLFVVKQNRYNLPVIKLKQAVDAGRFGKLVLGTVRVRWCRDQSYYDQAQWRGTRAMDGGVFANQASHHIDLLQWMMGPVESVYAMCKTQLHDIETEDTAVAVLTFASGALGVIEATTCARPRDLEGSISILGEKGTVEIGGFAANQMKVWQFLEVEPADAQVLSDYSALPPNVYGYGHQEFYRQVLDALISGTDALLTDGAEGRKSLEIICALYESARTGSKVYLAR